MNFLDENNNELIFDKIEKYQLTDKLIELADAGIKEIAQHFKLILGFPIMSLFFGGIKLSYAVNDFFLAKKVLRFLVNLNSVKEKEIIEMFWDLQNDKEKREEIGLQIISIINNAESFEKADFQGRLFKYYSLKMMDSNDFLRFSMIVSKKIVEDLNQLPLYMQEQKSSVSSSQLHSFGLVVRTSGHNNKPFEDEEDGFQISRIGLKLIQFLELD